MFSLVTHLHTLTYLFNVIKKQITLNSLSRKGCKLRLEKGKFVVCPKEVTLQRQTYQAAVFDTLGVRRG